MKLCCVCGLTEHAFLFPKDAAVHKQWVEWVKQSNPRMGYVTQHSTVCYLHFSEQDIENYDKYRLGFDKKYVSS